MEGNILATLDFRQTTRSDRFPLPQTGNLQLTGWQPAAHCAGARQSHNAGPRPQRAARSAPRLTTPNALVFLRRFVKAACPARSPAAPRSQPELHAPRVDTYNTAHRAPPLAGGQSTSHALGGYGSMLLATAASLLLPLTTPGSHTTWSS